MTNLEDGQVLEVQATDKGSKADLAAWAQSTGHQYIGTVEKGDVLYHYIRKCNNDSLEEVMVDYSTHIKYSILQQRQQLLIEVGIFFTFEGLNLIHKQGMHALSVPAGREAIAKGFEKANVPSILQLIEMAQELGVKFIACQMTMDVMGITKEDLVDGIDHGGAVTFLEFAKDASPTLTF